MILNNAVTQQAIALCESGYVPDTVVRAGVRSLCKRRLANEYKRLRSLPENDTNLATPSEIAVSTDKANEQHYELPSEFFTRILGPHRKYSCCFWESGTKSLEVAERESLKITCQRAEIADGMRVLELGCGWGALTLYIAQQFPSCQITAVSNSNSQRKFILAEAARLGCDRNLDVITADINRFQPSDTFERIVSIEMFEHVRNHRELLRRIARWLAPEGRLFVHWFCHRELSYTFEEAGPSDWMSQYFFTGGMMPSADLMSRFDEHFQVDQQWNWNGEHYRKTANAWLQRMDANRDSLTRLFRDVYGEQAAEIWFQRWRIFFMAVAELFGYRKGREWFVAHYLMSPARVESPTNSV